MTEKDSPTPFPVLYPVRRMVKLHLAAEPIAETTRKHACQLDRPAAHDPIAHSARSRFNEMPSKST